jgi:extracellular factor (EF) 3-hydroxypalmitic acid methyl ester biosynthesis protein
MNSTAFAMEQDLDLTPVRRLLDDIHNKMITSDGPLDHLIDRLVTTLESVRASLPPDLWARHAPRLVSHPLTHLLHQDPFTRRCYTKPRGYAGDARMIDYIYGEADDDDSTALGRRILAANFEAPAPRAVRYRKEMLAAAIDRTADRVERPRVFAVACGHLREARRSQALQSQRVGELIAFDQDARSLAVVDRDFRHLGVRTEPGRVRDLIVGRRAADLTGFDLVYAAGLYDYLRDDPARRLTQTLFEMLNPGGTLLVANFLTGIRDRGYMESFMDWHLIYRTMAEIEALADGLPRGEFRSTRFEDPDRVIGFIEITRT